MHAIEANFKADPRVMCGLVARSALEQLDLPKPSPGEIYAITLLRLLQTYRYKSFRSADPRGILESTPITPSAWVQEKDSDALIREAIHKAHQAVFPEASDDEFVQLVSIALKSAFGLGEGPAGVRAATHAELKAFLERLTAELKAI